MFTRIPARCACRSRLCFRRAALCPPPTGCSGAARWEPARSDEKERPAHLVDNRKRQVESAARRPGQLQPDRRRPKGLHRACPGQEHAPRLAVLRPQHRQAALEARDRVRREGADAQHESLLLRLARQRRPARRRLVRLAGPLLLRPGRQSPVAKGPRQGRAHLGLWQQPDHSRKPRDPQLRSGRERLRRRPRQADRATKSGGRNSRARSRQRSTNIAARGARPSSTAKAAATCCCSALPNTLRAVDPQDGRRNLVVRRPRATSSIRRRSSPATSSSRCAAMAARPSPSKAAAAAT